MGEKGEDGIEEKARFTSTAVGVFHTRRGLWPDTEGREMFLASAVEKIRTRADGRRLDCWRRAS